MIREYKDSDFDELRRLFSLLQDYERDIEPLRLPADQMVDAYMAELFKQMEKYQGKIYLSVIHEGTEEQVTGYISLYGRQEFDDDLNHPAWIGYVTDLIVVPEHRKSGAAQELMKAAEDYARSCGAIALTLNVLGDNKPARRFYEKSGFKDYQLRLRKDL